MLLLLLTFLLQSSGRSWLIVGAIIFVFLLGVGLLIYFYKRFKQSDKEADEDWGASRSNIFGGSASSLSVTQASAPIKREEPAILESRAQEPTEPPLESIPALAEPTEPTEEPAPLEDEPFEEPAPLVVEQGATEILTSETDAEAVPTVQPPEPSESTRDVWSDLKLDDVWADLKEAVAETTPQQTTILGTEPDFSGPASIQDSSVTVESVDETEPEIEIPVTSARVDDHRGTEPFEAPRMERVRREAFEPPSVTLVESRQRSGIPGPPDAIATETIEDQPVTHHEPPSAGVVDAVQSSLPVPPPTRVVDAAPAGLVEPAIRAGQKSRTAPAGSVLGIPAESSNAPLVLGTPVKPSDDIGIGGLTTYGKDTSTERGGYGGTIALAVVIVLVGGAILAYFKVPSVNSQVNAWVAKVRGIEQSVPAGPRAQIFPGRSEVDKNLVKASGAVTNISNDPLSDASIEVVLQGANSKTINVTLEPSELQPQSQGRYQFEYDGKEFAAGYRITRLISAGQDVQFARPDQGTASR